MNCFIFLFDILYHPRSDLTSANNASHRFDLIGWFLGMCVCVCMHTSEEEKRRWTVCNRLFSNPSDDAFPTSNEPVVNSQTRHLSGPTVCKFSLVLTFVFITASCELQKFHVNLHSVYFKFKRYSLTNSDLVDYSFHQIRLDSWINASTLTVCVCLVVVDRCGGECGKILLDFFLLLRSYCRTARVRRWSGVRQELSWWVVLSVFLPADFFVLFVTHWYSIWYW